MTVTTDLETIKASLVNVIPPQQAGSIARFASLADDSGFCPVDADKMRLLKDPNIYVIGNSTIGGGVPMSGFAANNEAKITAMFIRQRRLFGDYTVGTELSPMRFRP